MIETRGPLALTLSLALPLPLRPTLSLILTTSKEEVGAGWAAQRTGRRLVVWGLEAAGATGRPGASTPVATRAPGIALRVRGWGSREW